MGQALYRKYRPKKLSEVVGQKHVVTVLGNAIKNGKVSHAYLFTGPRGVGKTSIARILAHEVNDLPYKDDTSHIDIIEIDAASNRRIDEIRDLREKVNISPASANYKVYIIDEVHMLTREAFNALLKTLEEPPEHAIFILATTDAHKVPETIASRTQQFIFKPLSVNEMAENIYAIAQQEGIKIDKNTAETMASYGGGSYRDSLSLLDQIAGAGGDAKLQSALVAELIGQPDTANVNFLVKSILSDPSPADILNKLEEIYNAGTVPHELAKSLSHALRQQITENTLTPNKNLVELLEDLLEVQSASQPQNYLELAILKFISFDTPNLASNTKSAAVSATSEPAINAKSENIDDGETKHKKDLQPAKKQHLEGDFNANHWPVVLDSLKSKHNTLYGVIRMAEPRFEQDKVILAFEFSFHQKRANEKANQKKLTDIVADITGQTIEIEAIVDKNKLSPAPKSNQVVQKDPSIEAISNIFDGAELLES